MKVQSEALNYRKFREDLRLMKKWFALFLVAAQVNVLPQQALASATKHDRKTTGVSSKTAPAAESSNAVMNRFITSLMKQMTLDEKLGQLNLLSIGSDVTGPVLSKGGEGKIALDPAPFANYKTSQSISHDCTFLFSSDTTSFTGTAPYFPSPLD
jgi:hypothetical protein